MPNTVTYANIQVLEFYRELPFNYHQSAHIQAGEILKRDAARGYPVLAHLLRPGLNVLEVGCGAGWLALSLSAHHDCRVCAIDFNPVAIERARMMAQIMHQAVTFETADLFLYEPSTLADLVISLGVLHHTNNCHSAIERLCTRFVRPGGHIFIGLYHAFGRRPFLNHFAQMQNSGLGEERLFAEYRRLHSWLKDETLARSWFRDQVLHPHETCHTLAELMPIIQRCGMRLKATSINGFEPFEDVEALFTSEVQLEQAGLAALAKGTYYPGFFLLFAEKEAA